MGGKNSKETKDQPAPGTQPAVDPKAVQAPQTQTPEQKKAEEKAKELAKAAELKVKEAEAKAKEAAKAAEAKAKEAALAAEAKAKEAAKTAEQKAKEAAEKAKVVAKDVKTAVQDGAHKIAEKTESGVDAVKKAFDSIRVHEEGLGKETEKLLNKTQDVIKDASEYARQAQTYSKLYYGIATSQFLNINRDAPIAIANFKKQYIFPVDPLARKIAFYGLTGLTLLVSIKTGRGLFSSIRNTAFVGATSGFFISPESINPFLYAPRYDDEEQQ